MKEKSIDKIYIISRYIIAIVLFITFSIMFKNEDYSWIILSVILAFIALLISFPGAAVSKKVINFGDKISNKNVKFVYYVFILPIIMFLIMFIVYLLLNFIYGLIIPSTRSEFGDSLGPALQLLFFLVIGAICVVVPYVQTIIVLISRLFIKK